MVNEVVHMDDDDAGVVPLPIQDLSRSLSELSSFDRDRQETWMTLPGYGAARSALTRAANLWAFAMLGAQVAQEMTNEMLAANQPLAEITETSMEVAETYVVRVRAENVLYENLAYLRVLANAEPELQVIIKSLDHLMRVYHVKPLDEQDPSKLLSLSPQGEVVKTTSGYLSGAQSGESVDVSLSLESYKTLVSFVSDVVQMLSQMVGGLWINVISAHSAAGRFVVDLAEDVLQRHLPNLKSSEVLTYTRLLGEVAGYALSAKMGVAETGCSLLWVSTQERQAPRQILSFDGSKFTYPVVMKEPMVISACEEALRGCELKLKALKSRAYMEIKIEMARQAALGHGGGDDEVADLLDV